jgi:hypothetical protein
LRGRLEERVFAEPTAVSDVEASVCNAAQARISCHGNARRNCVGTGNLSFFMLACIAHAFPQMSDGTKLEGVFSGVDFDKESITLSMVQMKKNPYGGSTDLLVVSCLLFLDMLCTGKTSREFTKGLPILLEKTVSVEVLGHKFKSRASAGFLTDTQISGQWPRASFTLSQT